MLEFLCGIAWIFIVILLMKNEEKASFLKSNQDTIVELSEKLADNNETINWLREKLEDERRWKNEYYKLWKEAENKKESKNNKPSLDWDDLVEF